MRSMWKGAISFGLVMIPVKLYAATEQKDIAFRQVHREDGGRIRFRRRRASAVSSRRTRTMAGSSPITAITIRSMREMW